MLQNDMHIAILLEKCKTALGSIPGWEKIRLKSYLGQSTLKLLQNDMHIATLIEKSRRV